MAEIDSLNLTILSVTLALLLFTLSKAIDKRLWFGGTLIVAVPATAFVLDTKSILNAVNEVYIGSAAPYLGALCAVIPVAVYLFYHVKRSKSSSSSSGAKTSSSFQKRPYNESRFESSQNADWSNLPDTAMICIQRQLAPSDICATRLVCKDWYNSATKCLESLKPSAFHPAELMKDFSLIRALDLSQCIEEVTAAGMVFLKYLSHLTEMSLGRHHNLIASSIKDDCLVQLTCLKRMQKLNLAQCVHVTDQGLQAIARSLQTLKEINISGCVSVTDIGVMELAQIKSLRSLEMSWCLKITDLGIEALTVRDKLKTLNINGCQLVTEAGIELISLFPQLEHLNVLNTGFAKVCLSDQALEKLSRLVYLESLSIGSVHMQTTRITDSGIKLISENFPNLKHLTLLWLDISNDAVASLTKLQNLTSLCMRGCTRVTAEALPQLARIPGLKELNLLHNPWMDINDDALAELAPLYSLEKLSIGDMHEGNVLTDNGMATLSGFKKLSTLNLSFFEWQFAGSGLGPLLKLKNLESLNLSSSANVSDSTLQVVAQIKSIKFLQLSKCNKITSVGLKHLMGLDQLEAVLLAGCFRVDDRGLIYLSEIPSLTSLNLSQCMTVSDVGVNLLKKCRKLKTLDVSGCRDVRGDGFEGFEGIRLHTLNISGCPYFHDGGLMNVGQIETLTKLEMCMCQSITDQGIYYLRKLEYLTDVDVTGCARLGDESMRTFSLLPRLTSLKANCCDLVTDYGMGHLVRLSGLLTAHFERCSNITDQSLVHLGNIASLTSLRLARCARITDAGISQIPRLTQLSILSVAQCPFITEAGLRYLTSLPGLASLEY